MKIITNSFRQTQKAGEEFAKKIHSGDVIFLYGNLGAGKTTFMQGLAKGLRITRRIISPTFIIVRSYEVPDSFSEERSELRSKILKYPSTSLRVKVKDDSSLPCRQAGRQARTINKLYHIDLYRTKTRHDVESVGLPDILSEKDAVVAIEWPEKLGQLPEKRYDVHFETIAKNKRSITIEKRR